MADNFTEESREVDDFDETKRQWLMSEDWGFGEIDRLNYDWSLSDYAPVEESRANNNFSEESR